MPKSRKPAAKERHEEKIEEDKPSSSRKVVSVHKLESGVEDLKISAASSTVKSTGPKKTAPAPVRNYLEETFVIQPGGHRYYTRSNSAVTTREVVSTVSKEGEKEPAKGKSKKTDKKKKGPSREKKDPNTNENEETEIEKSGKSDEALQNQASTRQGKNDVKKNKPHPKENRENKKPTAANDKNSKKKPIEVEAPQEPDESEEEQLESVENLTLKLDQISRGEEMSESMEDIEEDVEGGDVE